MTKKIKYFLIVTLASSINIERKPPYGIYLQKLSNNVFYSYQCMYKKFPQKSPPPKKKIKLLVSLPVLRIEHV